jgi:hypothetical protein
MRSKSEGLEIRVEEIEAKNGRDQAFLELWRSIDFTDVAKNQSGRLRRLGRGDIGETVKRLTAPSLFLRISGRLSVNFEYTERIKYAINLLNEYLRRNHDWGGKVRGYWREMRRRRGFQF